MREVEPRIAPLPEDEWTTAIRTDLESIPLFQGRPFNIFTTLARHPRLLHRWLPFGGKLLLRGSLPARDRELLILRAAWNTNSHYEWGQHLPLAAEAGITDEEVARLPADLDGSEWHGLDRALLQAADELHASATISDPVWQVLCEHYQEEQLIEVPLVVGHYTMLAYFLNGVRVPLDPGLPGLPGVARSAQRGSNLCAARLAAELAQGGADSRDIDVFDHVAILACLDPVIRDRLASPKDDGSERACHLVRNAHRTHRRLVPLAQALVAPVACLVHRGVARPFTQNHPQYRAAFGYGIEISPYRSAELCVERVTRLRQTANGRIVNRGPVVLENRE